MSELVTVYASVPPNGKSNPGAILYRGVYFSVTLRESVVPVATEVGFEIVHGNMETAFAMMDAIVNAHENGLIQIAPECLWRDPADQRPSGEQNRSTSDSAPQSNFPDNWLRIRKVSRGTTKSGSPQVYLFADPNSSKPDLQFPPKFAKPVNTETGIDWAADINAGKMTTCDFVAEWKWSDDGKYKNFVRVVKPAAETKAQSSQRSDIPF